MSHEPRITLGRPPDAGWLARLLRTSSAISAPDARAHAHVIGVSGTGKSRFLAHLYVQLVEAGYGATLIDPHGDLAELVVKLLQTRANHRVIYLDFPAAERNGVYVPLNLLAQALPRHTIAGNVTEAFHRAWPQLAGGHAPMFDMLLDAGVKVLIANHLPLTALWRLLVDAGFRQTLLANEPDPEVRSVFADVLDAMRPHEQRIEAGSLLRRLYLLTASPVMKYSLGQSALAINFRQLMDERRALVVNLALPDAETRRLVGCLLTVGMEQAALSRADTRDRPEHFLFLDEFASFAAQSAEALSAMLSQTRKYHLFLCLVHQQWSQASTHLQGALQNVGLEVVFRLGQTDAARMATVLAELTPWTRTTKDDEGLRSVSVADQITALTQTIKHLPPRHALIRTPDGAVQQLVTPNVREPAIAFEPIRQEHLARWFRPPRAVATPLAQNRVVPIKRKVPR